jgi:hypothetical protein
MQYHNEEFRKPDYHLYDGIQQHPQFPDGVCYDAPPLDLVPLVEVDKK